jgi:hypothetical protein
MFKFYYQEHQAAFPDMEKLLSMVETEPILEVIANMSYHFPPEIQGKMDRILLIASQRISLDKDCELFIREHFFEPLIKLLSLILNRAVELGRLEPFDIDSFVRLATFYAFSAAELNSTVMQTSLEQWKSSLEMLYSLLKLVKN